MRSVRNPLVLAAAVVLISGVISFSAAKKKPVSTGMDERQRAIHALNRLTFGPRPGDVERVMAIGVDKWIEQQLHPDHIDDAAMEARLSGFRTLKMDTQALLEQFPPRPLMKAVTEGKLAIPNDPKLRPVYEARLDAYENRKAKKAPDDAVEQIAAKDDNERREARQIAELKLASIMQLAPEKRFEELMKLSSTDLRVLGTAASEQERGKLLADLTPEQRERLLAMVNPPAVVTNELVQAKLLRAIGSERQLQEVMTDFWFNHFNVFIGKGADRYLVTSYERDVIRPHAMGKFKGLLMATAKSPAMLFYLDNWQSVGPNSVFAKYRARGQGNFSRPRSTANRIYRWGALGGLLISRRRFMFDERFVLPALMESVDAQQAVQRQKQAGAKNRSGLNENYARELMELHTLGVDGGYTQSDVTEVARVFTGWTLREPRRVAEFDFNARLHEPGSKHVLGQRIKDHGEDEGKQVLEILARHPSTAKFISTKLAQRFVSDTPPESLIDRMAKTFLDKDGDIREVLRTMFKSPEFWSADTYRAKVKTPLEFVASAVRASGAEVTDATVLAGTLNRMGMPLYGAQPPTGYSMKADAWVNSAALLNRMNFALGLAAGKINGVNLNLDRVAPALSAQQQMTEMSSDAVLGTAEQALLNMQASQQTHETILKQMTNVTRNGQPNIALITGLLLGSPEFQRR